MSAKHNIKDIFDDSVAPKGANKLGFGIHVACDFDGVEKGENFLDLKYIKDGKVQNKRLWYPTGKYPKNEETEEQAILREEASNMAHMLKHMHVIAKTDVQKMPDMTYDECVDKTVQVLTPFTGKAKINLKLIYDSEGTYSTFGNYPDYIEEFIEGKESTLKYSPWELANRCTPKAKVEVKPESTGYEDIF